MMRRIIGLGLLAGLTWAMPALAQEARCPEPACAAVAGGRTEGWAAQSRAEVIARNGMVTSSQPLATQAGLAILRKGGNAVDAAVATAAALGVVEPFSTGIASDLFMIVWVAKEKKLYALNAAGTAPTGASGRSQTLPAGARIMRRSIHAYSARCTPPRVVRHPGACRLEVSTAWLRSYRPGGCRRLEGRVGPPPPHCVGAVADAGDGAGPRLQPEREAPRRRYRSAAARIR
jgi:hypothetical protein